MDRKLKLIVNEKASFLYQYLPNIQHFYTLDVIKRILMKNPSYFIERIFLKSKIIVNVGENSEMYLIN
jgi:hypothetical protein